VLAFAVGVATALEDELCWVGTAGASVGVGVEGCVGLLGELWEATGGGGGGCDGATVGVDCCTVG
jgi:hypothetical protein